MLKLKKKIIPAYLPEVIDMQVMNASWNDFFLLAPPGKSKSLSFPGRKTKLFPSNSDFSLAWLPLNP